MTDNTWMPLWLRRLWEIPGVTDVMLNGPHQAWIDRGLGMERAAEVLPDIILPTTPADTRQVAVRLASLGGRRLDDASPTVDARLPDGSRFHAVLPPVADGCAVISLRRVRQGAMTWDQLLRTESVHPELATILRGLVAARASIIVSGATGSGKTTMLSTLLGEAAPSERLVVIEEAGEIHPNHPHLVRLQERRPNVDGAGGIGLDHLVREALRMRPDRIVLGECRGAEIREVLLALNTGHRGSLTTLHANAAQDVPARLIALGALADLPERAVALHAASAFDAIVHMERDLAGRKVVEVAALDLVDGSLHTTMACKLAPDGSLVRGPAWPALNALAGASSAVRAVEAAA